MEKIARPSSRGGIDHLGEPVDGGRDVRFRHRSEAEAHWASEIVAFPVPVAGSGPTKPAEIRVPDPVVVSKSPSATSNS